MGPSSKSQRIEEDDDVDGDNIGGGDSDDDDDGGNDDNGCGCGADVRPMVGSRGRDYVLIARKLAREAPGQFQLNIITKQI